MKIIITNIPAFYKIRLFNEINKYTKIKVVFIDSTEEGRNDDFVQGKIDFEYIMLTGNLIMKIIKACGIILRSDYKELILGSWDYALLWVLAFISPKEKNSLILESSCFESKTRGLIGIIKKLFLTRVSKIYAPGISNVKLANNLGFTGKTVITKGVGVFNYGTQPKYTPKREVRNFLFVGRLIPVKNLKFLIHFFNSQPSLNLHIVGFGEQEKELKAISNSNIYFYGAVNNSLISDFYRKMDVFILPSVSETWGLVVEEALNNGIPVVVSDRVGCAEEIVNEGNGLIFKCNDESSLMDSITKITNIDYYNRLLYNISKMNFDEIELRQVLCYTD